MKIPQLGPPLLVPLEASGGHRRQRERQRSPPAHSSTSMTDVRNVEMTEAGPTLDMGGVAEAVGSVPMECDDRVAVDGEQVVTNATIALYVLGSLNSLRSCAVSCCCWRKLSPFCFQKDSFIWCYSNAHQNPQTVNCAFHLVSSFGVLIFNH